jgi:hypothetical protein
LPLDFGIIHLTYPTKSDLPWFRTSFATFLAIGVSSIEKRMKPGSKHGQDQVPTSDFFGKFGAMGNYPLVN